jgi:integrase
MSVYKLRDKPHGKARKLPWRAVVPREGQKRLIQHFLTREEANMWEAERRKEQRLNDVPEFQHAQELKNLRNITVRDLIFEYIKANPTKFGATDICTLNTFAREEIASKSVLEITKQDARNWVQKKLNSTWKPPKAKREPKQLTARTVRRHCNIVQGAFQWTIDYRNGFAALPNVFRGITIKGSTGGRRGRSLEGNELERMLEACKDCHKHNKYYLPLAIYLAIDTGMRRQELFNLWWSNINDVNRRITIRKSKTDKIMGRENGTTIVLPALAKHLLVTLALVTAAGEIMEDGMMAFPTSDKPIFPMSQTAFTQAFRDVLKRAEIKNLHFHDLRREANNRFIRAGLTEQEQRMMLRHADARNSMLEHYIGRNPMLETIQDKLDRFVLNGKTLEEAYAANERVDFAEAQRLHLPVRKREKI